jgi:hypothetical protein
MPTQRELILEYLRAHPQGADDDLLAIKLGIPHRQAVNKLCRQLEQQGVIVRRHSSVEGKIVNRLVASGPDYQPRVAGPASPPVAEAVASSPLGLPSGPLHLKDDEELRLLALTWRRRCPRANVTRALPTHGLYGSIRRALFARPRALPAGPSLTSSGLWRLEQRMLTFRSRNNDGYAS